MEFIDLVVDMGVQFMQSAAPHLRVLVLLLYGTLAVLLTSAVLKVIVCVFRNENALNILLKTQRFGSKKERKL